MKLEIQGINQPTLISGVTKVSLSSMQCIPHSTTAIITTIPERIGYRMKVSVALNYCRTDWIPNAGLSSGCKS